jgi:curved DNA-binding protein CbpA
MERDYYSLLGVNRFASQDALRRAFRSSILRIHPDRNPADQDAADRARQVIQAYEILRDPGSRRRYDNTLAMPTYAMTPRYTYEGGCPQWLTRCFVLLLFFAMSAGLLCIVTQSFSDNTPVFRPMSNITSFQVTRSPAVKGTSATRGDQSINLHLNCLEQAPSSDPHALN